MSLPCEGFSHRNTRMKPPRERAVHQASNSMAGPGETGSKEAGRHGHRIVIGWGMVAAGVCTDRGGMRGGRLVSGGRPGTRWSVIELSPGDSPLVHGGRLTVATAAREVWSLAPGGLGAKRHRLDAIRQDADAPGPDFEGDALVLVGVLPFVAYGAAFNQ